MKSSKKSVVLAGAALAVALTAGAGVIHAQTATATGTNPMSALVTALSQKFNLNATEVQTVVDQTMEAQHAQMEAQRQQEAATRLAQLVTDGKLTQAQADLIKAKQAELETSREANRTADQSLTMEQRKAKMDAERTALEIWATQNNIPTEYLRMVGGGKGHGGRGGFGGEFGPRPAPTTSSTQSAS